VLANVYAEMTALISLSTSEGLSLHWLPAPYRNYIRNSPGPPKRADAGALVQGRVRRPGDAAVEHRGGRS
jgi:hypothetical protein